MIRQVLREDWDRLRDVRLRALAHDPEAFLETHAQASAFPDELWQQRATPAGDRSSFVIERDRRFDGLVSCFVADDPATVFLVAMWVAPELRGTGNARALVERVVDWAREHGAARVCLSVEPNNERAARLYEKCGFVETPRPAAVPLRAERQQPLLRVRALTMERWEAHGNVYLVAERELTAEDVRAEVGEADGIVQVTRARRRLGGGRHLEPRRFDCGDVGQRNSDRRRVARRRADARARRGARGARSPDG